MYFGVEFFHAAIVAMLGAVSILSGLISGNWFLMGITVFYYSMMVKINDRTRFYDIRTRLRFFAEQQEFKW